MESLEKAMCIVQITGCVQFRLLLVFRKSAFQIIGKRALAHVYGIVLEFYKIASLLWEGEDHI
jgi:hypothetical protein